MTPNSNAGWSDLLRTPSATAHVVQLYQDEEFLAEAVTEYIGAGLRCGEAAILIVTPAHRTLFIKAFAAAGLDSGRAISDGQLRFLDASATLQGFMRQGLPDWHRFRAAVGGALAGLRCEYPGVRAYGEMVDVLWRDGRRDAAIRLEEYWNDLAQIQTFSLLCAYYMDNLDPAAYNGPLECVCKAHSHLIPARHYARFDAAVSAASEDVLDPALAGMLKSLSSSHRCATQMPLGQATLLWLKKNMPRTADKVLDRVRTELG